MTDAESAAAKADDISRARRIGRMLITEASPGEDDTPEKILLDFAKMSAKEMRDAYLKHMATFETLPLDASGEKVRLYAGEWSIWSGFPGAGKTTAIRQMACKFMKSLRDGECVFIATLEQDPSWYIVEMAGTAAGVETPSEEQITSFLDTYGDKLKIWGIVGIADHKKILATVRDLATNHGCKHAIIDSLMALDIDSGDNEAQRQFSNLLSATARTTGVHVHLVAHPRKPLAADQAPNSWDVAGSSDLGRLAFNIFFLRRGPQVTGVENISNMLLHVVKQRTKGWHGEIAGCFYSLMRQFHLDAYATMPIKYLPDDQYDPEGMSDEPPFVFKREEQVVRPPWEL